jgi:hypothetical protein
MKRARRTLTLKRETIKLLQGQTLERIVGGAPTDTVANTCAGCWTVADACPTQGICTTAWSYCPKNCGAYTSEC